MKFQDTSKQEEYLLVEKVNKEIEPFSIFYQEEEDSFTICLGSDKFYNDGEYNYKCTCHEIQLLAKLYIIMNMPNKKDDFEYDSENDCLFMYSKNIVSLIEFISGFIKLYNDKIIFNTLLETVYWSTADITTTYVMRSEGIMHYIRNMINSKLKD